jgi:hypothetical protein
MLEEELLVDLADPAAGPQLHQQQCEEGWLTPDRAEEQGSEFPQRLSTALPRKIHCKHQASAEGDSIQNEFQMDCKYPDSFQTDQQIDRQVAMPGFLQHEEEGIEFLQKLHQVFAKLLLSSPQVDLEEYIFLSEWLMLDGHQGSSHGLQLTNKQEEVQLGLQLSQLWGI